MNLHEFDSGVLQPSPLKGNLVPRLQAHRGGYKRGTHASLWMEKLCIHGTEELLSLSCSLLLKMTAHDSNLLPQKLHWMLWIRQVGIKRHDITNDNISERL
jgi:hypothetical protein